MRGLVGPLAALLLGLAALRPAGAAPLNVVFDPYREYGAYDRKALANPNAAAIVVNMDWADVEPERGTYDFAPADREIAAWARAGKRFALVIRYTNEAPHGCSKAQRLPAWEISRIPTFCDAVFGNIVPDWFDPTFREDLQGFVRAVAEHVNHSPHRDRLLYVRVGVGLGSEGFYLTPCRRDGPCDFARGKAQLERWGYSPSAWAAWQIAMLKGFKASFGDATLIYPLNRLEIDPATGRSVQADVARWAAENGFGLGAEGLGPRFADGPARIRDILVEAKSRHPGLMIQLQTVGPVADIEILRRDMELAQQLGTDAVEWYTGDMVDPAYQPALADWRR